MYIEATEREPGEAREGLWKEPWNSYWESWLIFDDVVYDLGRFGSGAEAGIAYATALLAFREDAREASRAARCGRSDEESVGGDGETRPGRGAVGFHDGCHQPHCIPVQGGYEVAR